MTMGQILFIFLFLVVASLMFFYLGAKFGPQVFRFKEIESEQTSFLPDEKITEEIKKILAETEQKFVFHEAVEEKKNHSSLKSEQKPKEKLPQNLESNSLQVILPSGEKTSQNLDSIPQTQTQETFHEIYRLQIGSFSDQKQAIAEQEKWQKRGYTIKISETEIPEKGKWYRLYMGHYTSYEEVQEAQKKLQKNFRLTVSITKQ